jgi:hypothetical protein
LERRDVAAGGGREFLTDAELGLPGLRERGYDYGSGVVQQGQRMMSAETRLDSIALGLPASLQADEGPRQSGAGWRRFLAEHWLICIVLLAATAVRAVALLAYPPALWFPDSLPYIQAAAHPAPYFIRPVGYSFLLLILEPAHSLLFVVALQHVMGVVVAAQMYALLRRHRLPAWGSALAAIPVSASANAIQIEHYVLSDAFFGLLVTSAIALLLWRPRPRVWVCCVIGILLAWAALDRSQGMLLIAPFVLYLAVARLGMRGFLIGAGTMCAAFLVPVLAYCAWYDQAYGSFEITTSTGAFLYSRVATFADCSVDKPPADERWLCVPTPVSKRESASWYLWGAQSPLAHGPAWAFSSQVNHLGTDFALRAIMAQPATYLRVVWNATAETFVPEQETNKSQRQYVFPAAVPMSLQAVAAKNDESVSYAFGYNGGANPDTRLVQPYADWMRAYQHKFTMPGPLVAAIALVGLIGGALAWRRSGPILLAWLTGAVLIVTPAATADYDARYVVASIPAFCIAAALGVREIDYRWRAARKAR